MMQFFSNNHNAYSSALLFVPYPIVDLKEIHDFPSGIIFLLLHKHMESLSIELHKNIPMP